MDHHRKPKEDQRVRPVIWFAVYFGALVVLALSSVGFWASSAHWPHLLPYEVGLMLRENPKIAATIWTSIATALSAFTLFLLHNLVLLMAKQQIHSGAKLSSIEIWSRLINDHYLLDSKRLSFSCLISIIWLAGKLLTTGYTTLLTPVDFLLSQDVAGHEIDFTSELFWDWYNAGQREIRGRGMWYNYNTTKGSVIFPTCPAMQDEASMVSAGISAAQTRLDHSTSSIHVVDKLFDASTGGVVPIGWAGLPNFADFEFVHRTDTTYPSYNYSLLQQGLSANVTCKSESRSPISRSILEKIGVTNSDAGGHMYLQHFTFDDKTCGSFVNDSQVISSSLASIANLMCQPNANLKHYNYSLRPFDDYADPTSTRAIENITCSITPVITLNQVSYRSTDNTFRQEIVEYNPNIGLVPNETVDAVRNLMASAVTSWVKLPTILTYHTSVDRADVRVKQGHMVVDALIGLHATDASIPFPELLGEAIRGFIEYEGTNLRMYYTANNAPGLRKITGTYSVWRVGYHGHYTALMTIAPQLCIILLLASYCVYYGMTSGIKDVGSFDPTNSTCLIAASAIGAANDGLRLPTVDRFVPSDPCLGNTRVRFDNDNGLISAQGDVSEVDTILLTSMLK